MNEDTNENLLREMVKDIRAFSTVIDSIQGVPVVEVRGEVDLATIPELLDSIGVACSRLDGRPLVLVDLRYAWFIDVVGVRNLIEQARAMRELGGELRLVVPEEGPVARAFELLEVWRRLELYHEPAISGEQWTEYSR